MYKLIVEEEFNELNYSIELNESTKSKNYIIKGNFSTPNKKNKNGRIYSSELWENNVNQYQTELRNNSVNTLMENEHPARTSVDKMKAVAKIRKVEMKDGIVYGEAVILNNQSPETNQLKALIDAGIPIGVSSRGVGKMKDNIVEDFKIVTWDIVQNPSNEESELNGFNENMILESKEFDIIDGKITCVTETENCSNKKLKEGTGSGDIAQDKAILEAFTSYTYQEPIISDAEKKARALMGLDESPVGSVGRTGSVDAENYIKDIANVKSHIRKLLKQVGGKTVLKKLIDQMNAQPQNEADKCDKDKDVEDKDVEDKDVEDKE